MFLLKNFYVKKGVKQKSRITFAMINFLSKGQGARVKIRKRAWLKQLKVAISTWESVPSEQSPQNS
jgi:hypothetical protein